jgi:hypothetical protein
MWVALAAITLAAAIGFNVLALAVHRMGRNHLAHASGDAINAVLAAAGYNFRRLLAWLSAGWAGSGRFYDSQTFPPLAAFICERPDAGSRMSREAHVRFCERAVAKFRRATRLIVFGQSAGLHRNQSPQ